MDKREVQFCTSTSGNFHTINGLCKKIYPQNMSRNMAEWNSTSIEKDPDISGKKSIEYPRLSTKPTRASYWLVSEVGPEITGIGIIKIFKRFCRVCMPRLNLWWLNRLFRMTRTNQEVSPWNIQRRIAWPPADVHLAWPLRKDVAYRLSWLKKNHGCPLPL